MCPSGVTHTQTHRHRHIHGELESDKEQKSRYVNNNTKYHFSSKSFTRPI